MEALIQAVMSNDLVKAKRYFGEAMESHKQKALEEQRKLIAGQIMVEGEEPDDDDDDTDDNDDTSDEDEDDEE